MDNLGDHQEGDVPQPHKRFSLSLQSQLVFQLLSILIPILLLQIVFYYERLQERRSLLLQSNLEVARGLAKTFEEFFKNVLNEELTIGLALTSSPPMSSEHVDRILNKAKSCYPSIHHFAFFDPGGRCTASSSPSMSGLDISDRDFFREIVGGKEWAVSNLILSRVDGKPIFTISHGIRNEEGNLLGVVSAAIAPGRLDGELAIERKGYAGVAIFDKEGRVVYRYPDLGLSWDQRSRVMGYEVLKSALEGKETSATLSIALDGKKRIVSDIPISPIGWAAGASVVENEAMAPVVSRIQLHTIIFCLVSIIAFLASLVFSRRITLQVRKLKEKARLLGSGKKDHLIEIGGAAEIQDLARSFNMMADKIRFREEDLLRVQDGLEIRVQERTAELEETNRALKAEIIEHNRARENLLETSRRLQLAMASGHLGIWEWDIRSDVLVWDDRMFELYGVSRESSPMCVEMWQNALHPDERETAMDITRAALSGEKEFDTEFRVMHPDGTIRVLKADGLVIRDGLGNPVRMVGLNRDITARKQAEEALRKSEREKAAILGGLRHVGVRYLDRNMRIIWANSASAKMLGISIEEMQGKRCHKITRGLDEPCAGCTALKAIETGRFQEGEITSFDGKTWMVGSNPIKDDSGKVAGIVHVAIEITRRKRMEEKLRESEEKYRMLFDCSPLGIFHFDKDGIITACNDNLVRILGSSKERISGLDLSSYLQDETARAAFSACMAGTRGRYEGHYRSGSGRNVGPLKCDYTPFFSEDGPISGGMAIIEDISERLQAQQALQESEAQLRFLSSKLLTAQEEERKRIAREIHDSLGSSLSAVKIALENARKELEDQGLKSAPLATPISWTQYAIDEARRMMTDLRPSLLDDLGLLATIRWFLRQYRAIHPGIYVEEEIGVEESDIPDALRIVIYRIFQEAFNNTAKYSNAEYVNLSLLGGNGEIELMIEDNGDGFDLHEILAKRDSGRGGLGLTSMKERTELSGGVFFIESTPGEGTIIRASWCASPRQVP